MRFFYKLQPFENMRLRIRRVNINHKIRRLGKHLNHLQLLYIRIPLYRYTSLYIGRGQVLFQNLFLTYPTPILGRIEGEFCECTKHRCYVEPPPSVAGLVRLPCALFFLQIFHAVEGDGGDDDKAFKHEL